MLRTKDLILFDVDDTLVESKCEMTDQMRDAFGELLKHVQVGIVTGGKWEIIKKNIIDRMRGEHKEYFHRLHILPTCGARYMIHRDGEWAEKYAHAIQEEDKERIRQLLTDAVEGEYVRDTMYGELVEDRGTQMTLSMFGQLAPIHVKDTADRDQMIRKRIVAKVAHLFPEYDFRIGGATSIDVTQKGIDKGFAIRNISEELGIPVDKIAFVGDAVYEGGNDYPAVKTGVHVVAVKNPEDTLMHLRDWLRQV
jgi:HAD superfamily hydrolase (TIGR01484 family)